MQRPEDSEEQLTYAGEPDVALLAKTYEDNLANLDYYFQQTRASYDNRRNYWKGKTGTGKKKGADAFPWDGSSDLDVPVIQERILKYVGIVSRALKKSWIKAYPVGVEDSARSRVVSTFLKWLQSNGIPRFNRTAERNANYWFEKGIMATHVGWTRKQSSVLQSVSMEDIAQGNPELAEMISSSDNDEALASLLETTFEIKRSRAKKAIKELRSKGETEIPYSTELVNRAEVCALSPDSDVILPAWCIDPQESPYITWRTLMTPQEILGKVESEGWDREWADYVIEHHKGRTSLLLSNSQNSSQISPLSRFHHAENGLIEVVHMYRRLIDRDDMSEGIYRTVFSPQGSKSSTSPAADQYGGYALHELLSGFTNYPFVFTKLVDDDKRFYDLQTFSDLMRSAQAAVKVERDSRVDRNSLANNPPLMHPAGRPPTGTWGPGQRMGYRRAGEFHFGDAPKPNPSSVTDEEIMLRQIDRMVGLDPEDPNGIAIQDYFVGRFLEHWKEVLGMAYDLNGKFGPEEQFFRVTGHPDMERLDRVPGERLDINICFNTLMTDPDTTEKTFTMMAQLFQFDDGGKLGKEEFLEWAASAIDPTLAAHVIKPAEEGQRDFARKVADDLTRIRSGIEVNAQPNGAPMAMQMVQQWAAQPDIAQELQNNELFMERLQKYMMQYVFQIQQQENAQTGRLGTPPAQFDITETKGVGQSGGA